MENTTPPGEASKPSEPPDAASRGSAVPEQARTQAPGKMSAKLVRMLLDATPEQRENAIRVTSKLLAAKVHKMAKKG